MFTNVYLGQFRCAFLVLIFLAACVSGHAAVAMRVTLGFDGTVKGGVWSPVSAELTNTTDDEIDGALTIEQPGMPFERHASCAARVVLPAHSKKLYHTYARINRYSGSVNVVFRRGGSIIAEAKTNANPASMEDRLVVSIGGRSARLNFLNGINVPPEPRPSSPYGSGQPSQSAVWAGSMAPRMLPDRPMGYSGVDTLVLFGLLPTSTNPKALNSIAMWVASGGTLVIPTGPNFRSFQNEFFDDLLPVKLTGTADLPGLPSLSRLGKCGFPAGAITVAKATPKPNVGSVVLAESGVPMIVERSYGAGRVVYLAFDPSAPPFRNWDGQTEFWKAIIAMPAAEPLAVSTLSFLDESGAPGQGYPYQSYDWINQSGGLLPIVSQHPAVRAPSFNTIGLFLVAYLILLAPINYFVLKRRKRLELAWITTPAIVILFTVGAYAVGYTMKGSELRLREVTVIEGSQDARFARAVSDASLFSPARRGYDITVDDPYSIAQAIPVRENDELPEGVIDEKCSLPNVRMAMWSSKMFESVGGVDLGGAVQSRLLLSGSRLQGEITNGTRVRLTGCVLCYADRHVMLGSLAPGQSAKVDLSVMRAHPPNAVFESGELDNALRQYAARSAVTAKGPVLVATLASFGPVFGVADARADVQSSTCCLFRLGYEVQGAFTVNPSSISTSVERSDNANVSHSGNGVGGRSDPFRVSMWGGGKCVVAFRLGVPAGASVTRLVLSAHESPPGAIQRAEVSAYNYTTGAWDVIRVPPTGRPLKPADFLSRQGELRVRIREGAGGSMNLALSVSAEGMRD